MSRRTILAGSGLAATAMAAGKARARASGAASGNGDGRTADPATTEAIRRLCARYFELVDNGRSAELSSVFTPDGQLLIEGANALGGQVTAGNQQAKLGIPADATVGYTHNLHQCTIVMAGEQAFGEVYATANVMVERDGVRRMLVRSIRYFDHYVPAGDEWRFKLRHHHVHWMYEVPLAMARSGPEREGFAHFLGTFGIVRP